MFLTYERIRAEDFFKSPGDFHSGAWVCFFGVVRNHSGSRKVVRLWYEADEAMAEKILSRLIHCAKNRWPVDRIDLKHRLGPVNPGEISLALSVWSAHREEAYAVSRYLVEEIKHHVPIWKKEYYGDGTSLWSLCENDGNVFRSDKKDPQVLLAA